MLFGCPKCKADVQRNLRIIYNRCKESIFLGVNEKFSPCKSDYCKKDEKYLKKVLASSEKGSTFAPAFPEREGLGKRGTESESSLKV